MHCTHGNDPAYPDFNSNDMQYDIVGLNRTGYMICSYLIEKEGWAPTSAVKAFMTNRPPGIYRRELVTALLSLGNGNAGESEDIEGLVGKADWVKVKKSR